jgi:hypothetical protein
VFVVQTLEFSLGRMTLLARRFPIGFEDLRDLELLRATSPIEVLTKPNLGIQPVALAMTPDQPRDRVH